MKESKKYREIKQLNLPQIDKEIAAFWEAEKIFEKSVSSREGKENFVFYEGPPSANGMPGIHHVLSRTIKDLFCRYKTIKGFKVERKGGWDTHGLPVELSVEKMLGISKEDIGKKISIAEFNRICREQVMKYKGVWDKLTREMGYWVDLDDPYITFKNEYIETLWYLLKQLYAKGLLYKGYTIQPFSPAAGTGLSSHELNLPGSYRPVKDTTVVAQFELKDKPGEYLLAWTTTPWTLPSNTALAVGRKIRYVKVKSFNKYTRLPIAVYLAEERLPAYFSEKNGYVEVQSESDLKKFGEDGKAIPYYVAGRLTGSEMEGWRYRQLMPYAQPEEGDAFRVIIGDFVTTEEGTGIVHIAPSFGSDDLRVARKNGIGTLTLVDRSGKFVDRVHDFAGRYVKNYKDEEDYKPVDIDIVVKLKGENKAFDIEKYEHNYPHCWRTDKPVIYYPMNSWFIKTTAYKERMAELNRTINWQPPSTGTGRFGNWLENLVDWNLSRSRYWGTPLPVWVSEGEDKGSPEAKEVKVIGSIAELREEVKKSVAAGFMEKELPEEIDLHRPYVDEIVLVSDSGKRMFREPDLIDVWFDSGAVPYAQWHYPFENKDSFDRHFPADFIAEGVDQTRGWFFTLHALAVMLFDSVAYKNVVSNGLVLDREGNKMSKRLGNAIDPFLMLETHGADAVRWYLMHNSQPWDNVKFDPSGVEAVKRKFFATLFNTYSFFALYANIDGFRYREEEIPLERRPEIDRWIISLLNSLIREVDAYLEAYEPTRAARAIQSFVVDHLSNWYVRLSRKRFWKGAYNEDKISAYQTLYAVLESVAVMMSPTAPFFSEFLFKSLNAVSQRRKEESVHLSNFPASDPEAIDKKLEERMQLAQDISSLVLSLRKKVNIKVRQPLQKILIPVQNESFREQLERVAPIILAEVNVKEIEYVSDTSGIVKKRVKPDFKKLGPRLGRQIKELARVLGNLSQEEIVDFESSGQITLKIPDQELTITTDEVEILSEDIPGWLVANLGELTVALDINLSEELEDEGLARELVNKIQRLRKESGLNVTDRIKLKIAGDEKIKRSVNRFKNYICSEVLASDVEFQDHLPRGTKIDINDKEVLIQLDKA